MAQEQEQTQNPLEIELSTLLDSKSHNDKRILNALKKQGVTTTGDLQSLLGECRYTSPKGRTAYPIRGLGENYFKRLEEVTAPIGIDIYPEMPLDPTVKEFINIAREYIPLDRYYEFRRKIEGAYVKGREEEK